MAQARPVLEAAGARGVNLVERSDLLTAAACLERADFFVGNDSGLMHLAAAAGTPTLGLFGPSPEVRYRPWGPHAGYVRPPESFEALTGAPGFHLGPPRSYMEHLTAHAAAAAPRDPPP